jgi:hypothetical protein
MHSALILAATIGQSCSGGRCYAPSFYDSGYVRRPSAIVVQPNPAPEPEAKLLEVQHEGLVFKVWGWKLANGNISWYPNDARNLRALLDARVAERDAALHKQMSAQKAEATRLLDELEASRKALAAKAEANTNGVQRPKVDAASWATTGVIQDHRAKGERYIAPTTEAKEFVEKAKANAKTGNAIGAANPHKVSVTVIGSDADRRQAVADLTSHPAFGDLRERINVQDYEPGHWAVDPSLGFKAGKPSIYVQTGRRVAWRAMDYSAGPERLAAVIRDELRKADPSYDPSKDPGPANSLSGCPFGFTRDHTPLVALTGVGLVFLALAPRKASQ